MTRVAPRTSRPRLEDTFVALSDPARLAVIQLLRRKPLCSSDIADALSMSRPTMSRHLGVLRKAGIVEETLQRDDARVRVYELRQEPFSSLRTWLDEIEAMWDEQLRAFKAHAEKKYGRPRS